MVCSEGERGEKHRVQEVSVSEGLWSGVVGVRGGRGEGASEMGDTGPLRGEGVEVVGETSVWGARHGGLTGDRSEHSPSPAERSSLVGEGDGAGLESRRMLMLTGRCVGWAGDKSLAGDKMGVSLVHLTGDIPIGVSVHLTAPSDEGDTRSEGESGGRAEEAGSTSCKRRAAGWTSDGGVGWCGWDGSVACAGC